MTLDTRQGNEGREEELEERVGGLTKGGRLGLGEARASETLVMGWVAKGHLRESLRPATFLKLMKFLAWLPFR